MTGLTLIHDGPNSLIYLERLPTEEGPGTVIKVARSSFSPEKQRAMLQREYFYTQKLRQIPGIRKVLAETTLGDQYALRLEFVDGITLDEWLRKEPPSWKQALHMLEQIVRLLQQVHQLRIVHKDLNGNNILLVYDEKENQYSCRLIDFSQAVFSHRDNLLGEESAMKVEESFEGTWAYMAPEQSRRMQSGIDQRSDLYSLGILAYKMCTGRLPFEANEPVEWVHAHIAQQPADPLSYNADLPPDLGQIILKLIAKDPEDRYATADELLHALDQVGTGGQPERNASRSQGLNFEVPHLGRAEQLETLREAYGKARNGAVEFVMIGGRSGSGMTSLVRQLAPEVRETGGYYLEGKFNPFQKHVPYSAWVKALDSFLDAILKEPVTRLEAWKRLILQALGNKGKLLTDVWPRLELLIGEQPEVSKGEANQALNRFNYVFQSFIDAISEEDFPLFIFIDDWQWADSASIGLLKLLVNQRDTDYFAIACSYRTNDIEEESEFLKVLKELRGAEPTRIYEIALKGLTREEIQQWVTRVLGCGVGDCLPLIDIVYKKTLGNPLFVKEMLKSLYEEGLLRKGPDGAWQWETEAILGKGISENVAEFISTQIRRLSEAEQEILSHAACVGDVFSVELLAYLLNRPQDSLTAPLAQLIQQNILVPYQSKFRFPHDRVRRVCYQLMPDSAVHFTRFRIGMWMLTNHSEKWRNKNIFALANHLNFGKDIVRRKIWYTNNHFDRIELARLNLQAAEKAKATVAYESSWDYLEKAEEMLGEDGWAEDYELTVRVCKNRAEVAYLLGDSTLSQEIISYGLSHVNRALDEVYLYNLLLIQYTLSGAYRKAFYAGKQGLSRLGFSIQEEEHISLLEAKSERVRSLLSEKQLATLPNSPELKNIHIQYALRILTNMEAAANLGFNKEVWALIVLKAAFLCLKYGHIAEASYAYATYGRLLISEYGEFKRGYELGKVALSLSEKYNDQVQICKSNAQFGGFINHWHTHIRHSIPIFEHAYQHGLESGELQFAGYTLSYRCANSFAQGIELSTLRDELPQYLEFARRTQNLPLTDTLCAYQMAIHHLEDPGPVDAPWDVADISEIELIENCWNHKSMGALCIFFLLKAQLDFLYGNMKTALEYSNQGDAMLFHISGRIQQVEYNFYRSLIITSLFEEASETDRRFFRKQLVDLMAQMNRWAQNCPENFLHKQVLMEAEINRIKGESWKAAELYDKAIAEARHQRFLQDEALANELAGKFWLKRGKQEFASPYLVSAHYLYKRWGAERKCMLLEQRFPQFFSGHTGGSGSYHITTEIDMSSLFKATQTISGEIVLSNLLEKLMKILVTNAGAVKGAFLTLEEGQLLVQALYKGPKQIEVWQKLPLEESVELPKSVIYFVSRTREQLVLEDAVGKSDFRQDPYVQAGNVKSVICFPVESKGSLRAIIYLENSLTAGAFSLQQIYTLQLLSSQVAISLENALLYENQEEKVRERTRELDDKNRALLHAMDQLKSTQAQLVDTAKMASLGQLTAGIAHEINNPINFVSANIKPLKMDFEDVKGLFLGLQALQYSQDIASSAQELLGHAREIDAEFLFEEMESLLEGIEEGALRTKEIVEGLKTFSYGGGDKFQMAQIEQGIDSTLMLLEGRLKNNITVKKKYSETPYVECLPGKLNQVFMNILVNAVQAINNRMGKETDYQGGIQIQTESQEDYIVVTIGDNGTGMDAEVAARIFEPFFTTRDVGKGTGLGLSISFGIIQQHGGNIQVDSQLGLGTTFIIKLPLKQGATSFIPGSNGQ